MTKILVNGVEYEVQSFKINWNNHLDEMGNFGYQTISYRIVLKDGTVIEKEDISVGDE